MVERSAVKILQLSDESRSEKAGEFREAPKGVILSEANRRVASRLERAETKD